MKIREERSRLRPYQLVTLIFHWANEVHVSWFASGMEIDFAKHGRCRLANGDVLLYLCGKKNSSRETKD